MKTSQRILGVLGIAVLLGSCQQETPEKLTIIEGTFANATTTEAYLAGHLKAPGTIELDEYGTFRDTLDIDADGYFITGVERNVFPLFVKKGTTSSFTVDLDAEKPSLQLTGGNQAIVDYLSTKRKTTAGTYRDIPGFFGKEPQAFKQQVDSMFTILRNDLSNLTAEESFKTLEEQSLKIDEVKFYNQYPSYYKYVHKLEEFEMPKELEDIFNNLDKDNEMYASNFETYRNMIANAVMDEAYREAGEDGMVEAVVDILKNKKSHSLRNAIINNLVYMFNPSDNSAMIKDNLIALADNDKTKEAVLERFDKIKNLVSGKSSPTFNYENFKGGTTALSDYKGKYVYIDVWATWCGPCIAEIPSLKALEHDYEGKNIEFVSISIDNKEAYENWRNMVADKALGGSQLMADNSFESKFVEDYAISAIPRFILLDPEGNIVSADAPRPSNEKLKTTFSDLGIK